MQSVGMLLKQYNIYCGTGSFNILAQVLVYFLLN